jgi:hypothetical protein
LVPEEWCFTLPEDVMAASSAPELNIKLRRIPPKILTHLDTEALLLLLNPETAIRLPFRNRESENILRDISRPRKCYFHATRRCRPDA